MLIFKEAKVYETFGRAGEKKQTNKQTNRTDLKQAFASRETTSKRALMQRAATASFMEKSKRGAEDGASN